MTAGSPALAPVLTENVQFGSEFKFSLSAAMTYGNIATSKIPLKHSEIISLFTLFILTLLYFIKEKE